MIMPMRFFFFSCLAPFLSASLAFLLCPTHPAPSAMLILKSHFSLFLNWLRQGNQYISKPLHKYIYHKQIVDWGCNMSGWGHHRVKGDVYVCVILFDQVCWLKREVVIVLRWKTHNLVQYLLSLGPLLFWSLFVKRCSYALCECVVMGVSIRFLGVWCRCTVRRKYSRGNCFYCLFQCVTWVSVPCLRVRRCFSIQPLFEI